MLSRRQFMSRASLVSLTPVVPSLFSQIAQAAVAEHDARTLVVIQLDGGNDGLNTVVPFGDDGYARNRDALRLDFKKLHRLNDHVGLHPQMTAAKQLFDDGRLTIVQGVGYPNPNRSHFESMRIWQTARLDPKAENSYGWLGRALDERNSSIPTGEAAAVFVGADEAPIALWGRKIETVTLTRADDMKLPFAASQIIPAEKTIANLSTNDSLTLFTTRRLLSAYATADSFQRKLQADRKPTNANYPNNQLGEHLRVISHLIKNGSAARVFYASQSGYDTHAAQLYTHARLLQDLCDALKAFLNDLKSARLEDRVLVLAFSEFGRRVRENSSHGTDHGAAGPVFLAGCRSIGGLVGTAPDLSQLDDGDLKMTIDLREIYTTILETWFGVNAKRVLGDSFARAAVLEP